MQAEAGGDHPLLDLTARWIKVTEVKSSFVLFAFTVADPDLTVELIMPFDAFDEFRRAQGAVLEVAAAAAVPFSKLASRY
ncbi:phenol hydroxylase [Oleomonas cavernae]|uniref:Phenol hydroxylase n=1 Tax=Oleomonas cavernae TaxID=2320859 RepID=A0A418WFS2_9PROT|nr:phenol hydroxylase subunit [Oleomonas cavernae]RJF88864.1 phenol hydroxylase [Oleomonas cavernae]